MSETNEQEAAMSLLGMIARAEQWWDQDEKLPSRRDILSAYADCVAAARGDYAEPETEPTPEPVQPIIEDEPSGSSPLAVGGVALYAVVRDLATAQEVAVNENRAGAELMVVDSHISIEA